MAVNQAASAFQIGKAVFGVRVDRAAGNLPQTTQSALFTVAGGRVVIMGIIGEVTTIIQAQNNNTKIVSKPTTGTAVDLCAVLNINGKEAGTLFGITGTFATAMVGANAGAGVMCEIPVVVPVGTVELNCAASNTGVVKWSLYYLPLDDGATVVAA